MTMASNIFGKKLHVTNIDYKSRLEHKLYLAREDPEPVFDLSECNLKAVPSGVYSLCKVFRKEKLLLQKNQLTSLRGGGQLSDLYLITLLDLHENQLSTLPDDICSLSNLQELNVSSNGLKKLPEAIGALSKLRVLNCSHNKLKYLPESVGQLRALTSLDVRGNANLTDLPPSLSKASSLKTLLVNQHSLQHLPSDILDRGTSAVIQFLEKQYVYGEESQCLSQPRLNDLASVTQESSQIQDSFELFENKKEKKRCELLELEKKLMQQKDKEYEVQESEKQNKMKLLNYLKEQQRKLQEDLNEFQMQKEQDRSKLVNHLVKVEKQTEETIHDLISLNQALRQSSQWQEQDRREQQKLSDYKSKCHALRRHEIINAMELLLAEECAHNEQFLLYEKSKSEVVKNSLLREIELEKQVSFLLNAKDARQNELVSMIEADTKMQKALVATLLERSDLHTQSLVMQLVLVEQQLAVLTSLELQRQNIDSQQLVVDLAEKRKALSKLLIDILEEKRERHKALIDKIHQLDLDSQRCGSNPDFWLQQYQRLLDVRPQQLRISLDPDLVHQIVMAGVAHCLPFLACCHIDSLTQNQLAQIGITSEDDQMAIMQAVETYLKHKYAHFEPSAPLEDECTVNLSCQALDSQAKSGDAQLKPTAPPLETAPHLETCSSFPYQPLPECVVCMEAKCAVVFVPCGHLCTCIACAACLFICPLCRADLQRKIHIFMP